MYLTNDYFFVMTKPQTHHAHFDQSGTIWSGCKPVTVWFTFDCQTVGSLFSTADEKFLLTKATATVGGKKLNLPSSADFILFVQKVTSRVKLWAQLQMDAILYPYSGAETVQQPLRRIWFPLSAPKTGGKTKSCFFF